MTEKCTICTPGVETPGFASVCVCEAVGGVVNGYVCDGKGNLRTVSDALHAAQQRIAELEGERDRLRTILSDIKGWECNREIGDTLFVLPADLRQRIQQELENPDAD